MWIELREGEPPLTDSCYACSERLAPITAIAVVVHAGTDKGQLCPACLASGPDQLRANLRRLASAMTRMAEELLQIAGGPIDMPPLTQWRRRVALARSRARRAQP